MTWQIWAISIGGILAMFALAGFGPALLAGMHRRPRPARHRQRVQASSGPVRLGADAGIIPRAHVKGAPPWPVRDDPGATVIEGPWGPARQYPTDAPTDGTLAYPCDDPDCPDLMHQDRLPAPELLDDLDGADDNLTAARAELATARGKLRQAHEILDRIGDELDPPETDDTLPPGHVQRADDAYCQPCEERCTWAQPCTCCWLSDLSEDQAAELDDRLRAEIHAAADLIEVDDAPELVLAEEAHKAQLRAQDTDARAFMERKAAEFEQLRPGR